MKSQQDIDTGNVKNQVCVQIRVFIVQAKLVTVAPLEHQKSVTLTDCHSKQR